MVANRHHLASWAANSAVFVGALLALGPVLLVASFAMPTDRIGSVVYDMAFSIFPQVCAQNTPLSECSRASGLPVLWSWLLWVPSAVCYGFLMREAPTSRRVLVGVVFVIIVLGLLQGIVHGAGLQQYIDAV
jgi:hypothetical protein